MKRIVIWGTGKTSERVVPNLKNDIFLIGYVDGLAKEEREYNGKPCLPPSEINNWEYDYILLCSIFVDEIMTAIEGYGICKEKVVLVNTEELNKLENNLIYKANFFEKKMDALNEMLSEDFAPELLITGISYQNDGIAPEAFPVKGINFAMRSQDIFYDYKVVRYLIEDSKLTSVKYVIIGLSYYSFEYDLSKSSGAWQISRYYPWIKDLHNLADSRYVEEFVIYTKKKMDECEDSRIKDFICFTSNPNYSLTAQSGALCAKGDYNKDYPETVWENKHILKDYISFLENNNITPIFVINPVMKHYWENVPQHKIDEFYKCLYEVLGTKDYQLFDCFKMSCPDEWFYHVSHLNSVGAKEFTKILSNSIKW